MLPELTVIPPVAALILAYSAYLIVDKRWLQLRRNRVVDYVSTLSEDIERHWFTETKGKSLRTLLLNAEIDSHLKDEIKAWFNITEFAKVLPRKTEEKEEGQPISLAGLFEALFNGRAKRIITPTQPKTKAEEKRQGIGNKNTMRFHVSRGWLWRLAKLFRKSVDALEANEKNFTEESSIQLQRARMASDKRRYVYMDLHPKEYEYRLSLCKRLVNETNKILSSIYISNLIKSGIPITAFLILLSAFNYLFILSDQGNVMRDWFAPSFFVVITFAVATLLRPMLDWAMHSRITRYWWSTESKIVGSASAAVTAIFFVASFYVAFTNVPGAALSQIHSLGISAWQDLTIRALIILFVSFLAVVAIRLIVDFGLEKWSRQFGFVYDATFASVLRNFALVYVVLFASASFVLAFPIGALTPDTIIVVYAFIGTLITAALGYASRDTIEGFFTGIMLRANPSFDVGDRIIIEDLPERKICDVREIGISSVRLYDVMSNTEMFVPNKKLSEMVVTNVSRPDLELRIQLPVMIRATLEKENKDTLTHAERILLDIAYRELEVDQAAISYDEIEGIKGRLDVESAWTSLKNHHRDIEEVELWIAEDARWVQKNARAEMDKALQDVKDARAEYRKARNGGDIKRVEKAVGRVIESFQILLRVVDSFAESKSWLKDDESLEAIKNELSKEPVIHSRFAVSDGVTYIIATLSVFALNLQRRLEVENRLNKEALRRLDEEGLLFKQVEKGDRSTPTNARARKPKP